jgi:GTP1/Obg family GTP-binding protein
LNTEQKLFDKISEIYGTTEWQDYLPSHYRELIPIKVEKDYTKCILNYSDIIHTVRQKIKESGIDKL